MKQAIGFAAIALALLGMATVVETFGKMDQKVLIQGGVTVTVLLGALTGQWPAVMQKSNKFSASTGLGFMGLAGSLGMLATVVEKFGKMDIDILEQGLLTVAILLASLAEFTRRLKTEQLLSASFGLTILGVALLEFYGLVKLYGALKLEELGRGLLGLVGILAAIAGFTKLVNPQNIISISAAMVVMSVSLLTLAGVMKILGSMTLGEVLVGLIALVGVFAILGGAATVLGSVLGEILVLSVAVGIFGLGVALLGVGVLALANGLIILSVGAASAAGAIALIGGAFIALIPVLMIAIGAGIIGLAKVIKEGAPVIADAFVALLSAGLKAFGSIIPGNSQSFTNMVVEFLKGIEESIPQIVGSTV